MLITEQATPEYIILESSGNTKRKDKGHRTLQDTETLCV